MSFEKVIGKIIEAEGDYTNHPDDPGGPTKYGIILSVLSKYRNKTVTAKDVEALTLAEAIQIYKKNYWDPMGLDRLKDERVQLALFDQGVNRGIVTAVKQAQGIANTFGGSKLSTDGVLGSFTSAKINGLSVIDFIREFLQASEHAYVDIVKRKPSQIVFLSGWLNRIHNLQDFIFTGSEVPLKPVEKVPDQEDKRPVNPAYLEAKKYAGKKETDSTFNKWLSAFWAKVGLPSYKTIIGTSFAWCGLFIAAMNSETGLSWIKTGAGARNWATYGQAIDWKKNGIPRGAVIHINHNSSCSSGSSNHVTFADGDCTASDLAKSGAVVPGLGGNQSNTVKRSGFPVNDVCAVRWPSELPLPKPVQKSVDCNGSASTGESTR